MLKIIIPDNNISERTYSIKVIFDNFLGIDYCIEKSKDKLETIIEWNDKRIIVADGLWGRLIDKEYLSYKYFPKVKFMKSEYFRERNIPVLYGDCNISNNNKSIYCGIDVFASVFFMLTRWEEYVVKKRDEKGRFIGKESVAYKNGFLNRPIVNEYVEFVWNMLLALGIKEERRVKAFKIIPTHDIDHPYMKYRFLKTCKHISNEITKGNIRNAFCYIHDFIKDPYNTFCFFMDISEAIGQKSRFYFMSANPGLSNSGPTLYKKSYLLSLVKKIKDRGHLVGFHPGYFSDNIDEWAKEKRNLENIIGCNVTEGRQHYLKFDIPETFNIWEKNNMVTDSTMAYFDVEGFRCGTGDEYNVFDVVRRKELKLRERPLIIMDGTLLVYQKYDNEEIESIFSKYISIAKKYNMLLTILFHNSNFIGYRGKQIKEIYKKVLLKVQ